MVRRRDELARQDASPGTDSRGRAVLLGPTGNAIAFRQHARRLMIASLDGSPPILVTDRLIGLGGHDIGMRGRLHLRRSDWGRGR